MKFHKDRIEKYRGKNPKRVLGTVRKPESSYDHKWYPYCEKFTSYSKKPYLQRMFNSYRCGTTPGWNGDVRNKALPKGLARRRFLKWFGMPHKAKELYWTARSIYSKRFNKQL